MKTLRKMGAIVLAIMMIAMIGTAWADDITMTGGVAGAFNTTYKDDSLTVDADKKIKIQKELTAYNPDASDVHAPVITYTYAITAGTAEKIIVDNREVHNSHTSSRVQTKAGIIPGLKITGATNGTQNTSATTAAAGVTTVSDTIVWNNTGTLHTLADGNANLSDLELDFNGVTYTGAGVYRYTITETASAYGTNGVVNGNGDSSTTQIRYLDVYVKDGSTSGSYDIYGYVCFEADNSIEYPTAGSVAAAKKTNGFVNTADKTSTPDASNADKYYTFDVEIQKDLVNDNAQNSNQFPFHVTFANSTVTSTVLLITNGTDTYTKPTPASATLSTTVYDGTDTTAANQIKIADGSKVKIIGIPAGTTVTIDEYNNVTGTRYKVKTEHGTTNITDAVAVDWEKWAKGGNTAGDAATAVGGTANTNAKVTNSFVGTGKTILFTNTLEYISPTGYVTRFAPYALILVGGILLLIIAKKRKHTEED